MNIFNLWLLGSLEIQFLGNPTAMAMFGCTSKKIYSLVLLLNLVSSRINEMLDSLEDKIENIC